MRFVGAFGVGWVLFTILCHFSYAQPDNSTLNISQNGTCGVASNQTCLGSTFGTCCSSKGYCGSTADYCGAGCQTAFGNCSTNSSYISLNGNCGATDPDHQICVGSTFGSCCSGKGYCGNTSAYCGTGCQSGYGTCGGANTTVPDSSASSFSSTTTSTSTSSVSSSTPNSAQTSTPASRDGRTSSTGFKAGIGVLGGVLGLSIIGLVAFFIRRRSTRRKQQLQSTLMNPLSSELPALKAVELGLHGNDKAELAAKENAVEAVEMPTEGSRSSENSTNTT